jgi:predicted metal-dependent enzyme (double-stranded beta helix superfamily)
LAIADGFANSAAAIPELAGLTERTWVLLAATDLFEAWAIGWPVGGAIELHDHGDSHGAVVVAAGALTETTVSTSTRDLSLITTRHIASGEHRRFGARYIHDLTNQGDEQAISVHVYAPRLTTMTFYRMGPTGAVAPVRTEQLDPVGPFDTTGRYDPS